MPLFSVGLQFLNLIPFIMQLINARRHRRRNDQLDDELISDMNMFALLGQMWLNLMAFYVRWLKMRYGKKIQKKNPHTLIRLLAGYRYVYVLKHCLYHVLTKSVCFCNNSFIVQYLDVWIILMMYGVA